jgi:hypothetical protein
MMHLPLEVEAQAQAEEAERGTRRSSTRGREQRSGVDAPTAAAAPPTRRSLHERLSQAVQGWAHIWWGLPTACKATMVAAGAPACLPVSQSACTYKHLPA